MDSLNVIHLVSNRVWGGGERYVLDLCRALEADGHSAAVITRAFKDVDARFAEAGFKPGHLPLRGAIDPVSPWLLARILNRTASPVVVHVHNFKDAGTAVRARRLMRDPSKVRVVVTRHLVKAASTRASDIYIYRSLDAIVFVSELARREFLSTAPDVDPDRLRVIHNAVTVPEALPVRAESAPDSPLRLLYLGRIVPEKGLDILVDALAELDSTDRAWTLEVAGEGPAKYVMPLMRRCNDLGLGDRVEWLGPVDDIWPVISRADVGVLPTRAREAFGLSLLEFMHGGAAVVSTDNGAQPEIIDSGTDGILVPPEPSALSDALRRLAADRKLVCGLADAGRRKAADTFGYDRFYQQMLALYRGQS